MKIEIDLPDWCEERNIRVMAGIEQVAYKLAGDAKIHVKTERCSRCGSCCKDLKHWIFKTIDGVCEHLKEDGDKTVCGLGVMRPYGCSAGGFDRR